MKVKELLSIKGLECFSINERRTLLQAAAKQMAECNIGALLVMDGVARRDRHRA